MTKTHVGYRKVPYFSQKNAFLHKEGSLSRQEIKIWKDNLCGLICSAMIINHFSPAKHTIAELLHAAEKIGAYHKQHGWVHKKIVALLKAYGMRSRRLSIKTLQELYALLRQEYLMIASVSPYYLRSGVTTSQNGHLVVIVGMNVLRNGQYAFIIHDPSSKYVAGGKNLRVQDTKFLAGFSRNVIACENPKSQVVDNMK